MKRVLVLVLTALLLLSLSACGGKSEAASVDLTEVYKVLEKELPEMFLPEGDMRLNILGVDEADCLQVITAVSADGLAADEVWLIQAKDEAAMKRLTEMANSRMAIKADETVDYLPDQYLIVEKGQVLTVGNYLALLVSPNVDAMKTAFEAAVK